ncbi:hypothetical protein BC826DRAFT_127500 [Russula brevipes]|nr:hypothetical protein BC826DRAFT_127500 [Russula brevipes]
MYSSSSSSSSDEPPPEAVAAHRATADVDIIELTEAQTVTTTTIHARASHCHCRQSTPSGAISPVTMMMRAFLSCKFFRSHSATLLVAAHPEAASPTGTTPRAPEGRPQQQTPRITTSPDPPGLADKDKDKDTRSLVKAFSTLSSLTTLTDSNSENMRGDDAMAIPPRPRPSRHTSWQRRLLLRRKRRVVGPGSRRQNRRLQKHRGRCPSRHWRRRNRRSAPLMHSLSSTNSIGACSRAVSRSRRV